MALQDRYMKLRRLNRSCSEIRQLEQDKLELEVLKLKRERVYWYVDTAIKSAALLIAVTGLMIRWGV